MDRGLADNVELRAPGGVSGSGPALVGQFYDLWQDGFPDCQVDPVMISEDGDNGTLEALFKGTHIGPLNAPSGTIPATNKIVEVPFVVTMKVAGEQFTSFHLYFDQAELMAQLGWGEA
ncbi:MAG: ester cyclase [Actinomycetota bacterium]|nr:ester cyclase [Actinomycetota bacterium]